jgi:hypothetical protein
LNEAPPTNVGGMEKSLGGDEGFDGGKWLESGPDDEHWHGGGFFPGLTRMLSGQKRRWWLRHGLLTLTGLQAPTQWLVSAKRAASVERAMKPGAGCGPSEAGWMSSAMCGEAVRVVRMDAGQAQAMGAGF